MEAALATELGLDDSWRQAFAAVERLVGGNVVGAERHERWRPAWYLEVDRGGGDVAPVYFRGDRGLNDHGVYTLEHEMRILQVLEAEGIPVPHVYGFCDEPRGIVMERCPGRANLATAESPEEARAVLEHYIEILARMHAIDLAAFDGLDLPRPRNENDLGMGDFPLWERAFRKAKNRPEPLIEFAIGWLKRNVPRGRTRAAFLAGDAGQFVFDRGRVTAILDLELAYIGDPLADFGGMLCRDLSEPLGDISHGIRHYAELTGEPVDLDVVKYHTIRFGMVTPLAVAPLCGAPHTGFNVAQYVGWNLVYGRIPLELIAEFAGAGLEPPELPEPTLGRDSLFHDAQVAALEAINDSYEIDTALRTAQYLREIDRCGPALEAQDLEEAGALLGRRVSDWREADQALEEAVLAAGPERDADFVRFFHRRTLRQEALLRPAMRELEHARLHTLEA